MQFVALIIKVVNELNMYALNAGRYLYCKSQMSSYFYINLSVKSSSRL